MASKYLQKFPIPGGFQQILSDFTRQVLRDQPSNIIEYAAKYFEMLEKGKKFEFDSKYNVKKDDKKTDLAYNPKNAEDITKKATNITEKLNKANEANRATEVNKANENTRANQVSVAPVQQQVSSHNVSEHQSVVSEHHSIAIGTEKTVTGQQTSNYVNNLANNMAGDNEEEQQQEQDNQQQQMIDQAVANTVEKLFEQIDIDKNGYLSSTQIERFVSLVASQMNQGANFKPEDIKAFIEIVDNDKDGKISKAELGEFILTLFKSLD